MKHHGVKFILIAGLAKAFDPHQDKIAEGLAGAPGTKTDWPENVSNGPIKAWIHPTGEVTHWAGAGWKGPEHDDVAEDAAKGAGMPDDLWGRPGGSGLGHHTDRMMANGFVRFCRVGTEHDASYHGSITPEQRDTLAALGEGRRPLTFSQHGPNRATSNHTWGAGSRT